MCSSPSSSSSTSTLHPEQSLGISHVTATTASDSNIIPPVLTQDNQAQSFSPKDKDTLGSASPNMIGILATEAVPKASNEHDRMMMPDQRQDGDEEDDEDEEDSHRHQEAARQHVPPLLPQRHHQGQTSHHHDEHDEHDEQQGHLHHHNGNNVSNDDVHDAEERLHCPTCHQRFSQRSSLIRHRNIVHLKKKKLACPHCQYRTHQRYNLQRHLASIHHEILGSGGSHGSSLPPSLLKERKSRRKKAPSHDEEDEEEGCSQVLPQPDLTKHPPAMPRYQPSYQPYQWVTLPQHYYHGQSRQLQQATSRTLLPPMSSHFPVIPMQSQHPHPDQHTSSSSSSSWMQAPQTCSYPGTWFQQHTLQQPPTQPVLPSSSGSMSIPSSTVATTSVLAKPAQFQQQTHILTSEEEETLRKKTQQNARLLLASILHNECPEDYERYGEETGMTLPSVTEESSCEAYSDDALRGLLDFSLQVQSQLVGNLTNNMSSSSNETPGSPQAASYFLNAPPLMHVASIASSTETPPAYASSVLSNSSTADSAHGRGSTSTLSDPGLHASSLMTPLVDELTSVENINVELPMPSQDSLPQGSQDSYSNAMFLGERFLDV